MEPKLDSQMGNILRVMRKYPARRWWTGWSILRELGRMESGRVDLLMSVLSQMVRMGLLVSRQKGDAVQWARAVSKAPPAPELPLGPSGPVIPA